MKVIAVCGFGVGSSMLLKMSLDKAIAELGVRCETDLSDVSSARGIPCDAIFTSEELAHTLREGSNVPIYAVKRYMDVQEVKRVFEQFLEEKGE